MKIQIGSDKKAVWIGRQVSNGEYILAALNRDGRTYQHAGLELGDDRWYFYRRTEDGQRPLTSSRNPVKFFTIQC